MLSDVIPVAARRPLDDLVGAQVGDYLIEGVLGRGGMGTVYAAVHRVIGKQVALKVIRAGLVHDPVVIERFEQEARAATRIGHRNIIDIYSYGALDDGRPYYVMERLRGRSLAVRIEEGALPLDEVAAIIGAICSALAAAHAEGVVHRDLKPDNIFLLEGAGPTEIKLLDFGVAKLQGAGRPSVSLTETGAILGTPRYMAPEQARGYTASAATDVYALGGIAYEMTTGAPAFQGTNAADLVAQHLLEPAPRLRDSLRVPRALDDLVAAMLAKEPEDRPTIDEIQEAFRGLANSAGAPRRRRWPLVAGTLVAAAAAAAIAWRFASPGGSAARTQPTAPPAQLGAEMSAASGDPSTASGDPRTTSNPSAASSGGLQRAHRDTASAPHEPVSRGADPHASSTPSRVADPHANQARPTTSKGPASHLPSASSEPTDTRAASSAATSALPVRANAASPDSRAAGSRRPAAPARDATSAGRSAPSSSIDRNGLLPY